MNRFAFLITLFLAMTALLPGCENEAKRQSQEQALLKSRMEERLDMAREVRREECERRLLDSALYIVDSLRVLDARHALDTIQRPHKPFKPEKPGPGTSLDSLEVKPLLPDSLIR